MTPEQIAKNTYPDNKSTRWWVHYPNTAYSFNIDFSDPAGIDRVIKACLEYTGLTKLEKGTEIYL